jgi:hypothetical protein
MANEREKTMTEENLTLRAELELKDKEIEILLSRIENLKTHVSELTVIAKERGEMIESLIKALRDAGEKLDEINKLAE